MGTTTLARLAATILLCPLAAFAARDVETEFRIEADERVTVGHYRWAVGKICYDIRRDDGSEGVVKMWSLGLGRMDQRTYRGAACFPVLGFARIRAGHADGQPVTIRVAADSVAALPLAGGAR